MGDSIGGIGTGNNSVNKPDPQIVDPQKTQEEQQVQAQEVAPNPPEATKSTRTAENLDAQRTPGQAGSSEAASDLAIPNPESSNPKADAAWGAMGATAQGSSGPKAVPGSENVIDTPEEASAQEFKRAVAQLALEREIKTNGAPEGEVKDLAGRVLDEMFVGKGDNPGGNVGFVLGENGSIEHKDADGNITYKVSIGGEGSTIDLNGDGQNDGARQYFDVAKSDVDAFLAKQGKMVPVMGDEATVAKSNPTPSTEAKSYSGAVPTSSELKEMTDAGIKKIQEISGRVFGEEISSLAASAAEGYVDSKLNGVAGALLDAAEPSLEAAAEKVEEAASQLTQAKESIEKLPSQAFEAIRNTPETLKALSPTLGFLSNIAELAGPSLDDSSERDIASPTDTVDSPAEVIDDADVSQRSQLDEAQTEVGFGAKDILRLDFEKLNLLYRPQ